MDDQNKGKIKEIIQKEIQLEDDMLNLYSTFLKDDSFLDNLEENDRDMVHEILNSLLNDTVRHKKTMEEIINSL